MADSKIISDLNELDAGVIRRIAGMLRKKMGVKFTANYFSVTEDVVRQIGREKAGL